MKRKSKIKAEICGLRSDLYLLLDGGNLDRKSVLKASVALDKAILEYMKNVKQYETMQEL